MKIQLKHFFLVSIVLFGLIILCGCQLKPTSVIEESADVFEARTVLMDTRSALDYTSYHIQGSANLLVEDFLSLQNPLAKPQNQRRFFDPNLKNTIERLAHRGIHPAKRIVLIGYKKDSIENKKWKWLLNNLDVRDVSTYSFDQVRKMKNGRFAEIESQQPWDLKTGIEIQKEFIINKAHKCFVKKYTKETGPNSWPAKYCQ